MKVEITEKELETIVSDLKKISLAICELYFVADGIRQNYFGGEAAPDKKSVNPYQE